MEHRVLPSLNSGAGSMGIDKYALMISVLMFLVIWKCTFCNFKEAAFIAAFCYGIRIAFKYYRQEVLGFLKNEFSFRDYYNAAK